MSWTLGWRAPLGNVLASAAAGPLPGIFILSIIAGLYLWLGWMLMQSDDGIDPNDSEVHV
jgi:uncharacterized membrane protein